MIAEIIKSCIFIFMMSIVWYHLMNPLEVYRLCKTTGEKYFEFKRFMIAFTLRVIALFTFWTMGGLLFSQEWVKGFLSFIKNLGGFETGALCMLIGGIFLLLQTKWRMRERPRTRFTLRLCGVVLMITYCTHLILNHLALIGMIQL